MKGERLQRTLTVLVLVLFGFAVLVQFFLPESEPRNDRPSVASFEPRGRRALFEVLRELGMRPEEWRKSPGALPRGAHVLWMADAPYDTEAPRASRRRTSETDEDPPEVQSGRFDLRARHHYRAFVEQGGTIVIPWTQRLRKFLIEDLDVEALAAAPEPETSRRDPATLQLRIPDGSELVTTWLTGHTLPRELLEVGADPYWMGVGGAAGEELLAVSKRLGEGSVVVLADDAFADNEHLGAANNAELCVRLFEDQARGGRLLFDEYALGRWDPETAASLALSSDLRPATLHLLAALVLLVWLAAWARAFPRDPEALDQLSPLSRARALAHLLRRAGRFGLAAQFLRRGELARLARAARIARGGAEPANAAAVERELEFAALRTQAQSELAQWKRAFLERKADDEEALDRLARELDGFVVRARDGARSVTAPRRA